jgi:hypothetical protein
MLPALRLPTGVAPVSGLLELVAGEELDSLNKGGAAPETRPDVGVDGSAVTPAEHSSLQRAEPSGPGGAGVGGPRESSHGNDPSDHVRAATEATGDFDLANPFVDQPEYPTLERSQRPRRLTHGSSATGVAVQTALILVSEMWQMAQYPVDWSG